MECDRQSLVAPYIGQTALKTNAVIERARGGVLFIDEAYSLVQRYGNDFGHEAVQVLLKRMEDDHGQFVVIVAGYPEEIDRLLESNPGLKSRFDTFINFEDYKSEELTAIATSLFGEEDLVPDEKATELIKAYFDKYVKVRNRFSGNARDVRKLVRKSILNQNLRLARTQPQVAVSVPSEGEGRKSIDELFNDFAHAVDEGHERGWIRPEDLSNWKLLTVQEKPPIGFIVDGYS